MTTVVILGATSGIGQATARVWAARGCDIRLVGRDAERTARAAADLLVRGAGSVASHLLDLSSADAVAEAVDWAFGAGPVDIALVTFGTMPPAEEADASYEVAASLLEVNGSMCLLAAHGITLRLLAQGSGALAVVGSVAGDRGRQSNYLYGAAKAMVATGVAGLQHRAASSPVAITLVKPGPTATPMTDHLRGGRLSLAKVETVAGDIVRGVDRGTPVVYTPRKWQLIMAVIRLLPRRVFERTKL